ncbi:hypothetical protein ABKV19_006918 [Rosa sericea]
MGCGASKYSSEGSESRKFENTSLALDHKLKGTTLIGFVYREGIIVGAESRASNEYDELLYPLIIRDDRRKMTSISSNMIYVVQGVEADCTQMRLRISEKFPDMDEHLGNAPTVSCVVETVYKYLNSLDDKDKVCGAIIAGWDASGPQVHRVFLKNKMVVKERACMPAALGSGQVHALRILNKSYNYNMSTADAIDLARKALFNATYYDKHSGGELNVYHINNSGWEPLPIMNALEAYTRYYDLHRRYERKTLFLVVDAGIQPISANDLIEHFKPHAKLFASHRVALCKLGGDRLYFHRLVFESDDDAERAYETTTPHGRTTPSYLERFPDQVVLDNKNPSVTVYVNWSSRDLLEFVHDECQLLYR